MSLAFLGGGLKTGSWFGFKGIRASIGTYVGHLTGKDIGKQLAVRSLAAKNAAELTRLESEMQKWAPDALSETESAKKTEALEKLASYQDQVEKTLKESLAIARAEAQLKYYGKITHDKELALEITDEQAPTTISSIFKSFKEKNSEQQQQLDQESKLKKFGSLIKGAARYVAGLAKSKEGRKAVIKTMGFGAATLTAILSPAAAPWLLGSMFGYTSVERAKRIKEAYDVYKSELSADEYALKHLEGNSNVARISKLFGEIQGQTETERQEVFKELWENSTSLDHIASAAIKGEKAGGWVGGLGFAAIYLHGGLNHSTNTEPSEEIQAAKTPDYPQTSITSHSPPISTSTPTHTGAPTPASPSFHNGPLAGEPGTPGGPLAGNPGTEHAGTLAGSAGSKYSGPLEGIPGEGHSHGPLKGLEGTQGEAIKKPTWPHYKLGDKIKLDINGDGKLGTIPGLKEEFVVQKDRNGRLFIEMDYMDTDGDGKYDVLSKSADPDLIGSKVKVYVDERTANGGFLGVRVDKNGDVAEVLWAGDKDDWMRGEFGEDKWNAVRKAHLDSSVGVGKTETKNWGFVPRRGMIASLAGPKEITESIPEVQVSLKNGQLVGNWQNNPNWIAHFEGAELGDKDFDRLTTGLDPDLKANLTNSAFRYKDGSFSFDHFEIKIHDPEKDLKKLAEVMLSSRQEFPANVAKAIRVISDNNESIRESLFDIFTSKYKNDPGFFKNLSFEKLLDVVPKAKLAVDGGQMLRNLPGIGKTPLWGQEFSLSASTMNISQQAKENIESIGSYIERKGKTLVGFAVNKYEGDAYIRGLDNKGNIERWVIPERTEDGQRLV